MSAFWKRGRSRVWHEFYEEQAVYGGPRTECVSLCLRHSFHPGPQVTLYSPWTGDDFPPDSVMCKGCIKARGDR